jgi:hypothetical protein
MAHLEFTSNWLQALMLASDNATARRIRPWMTDLDSISASKSSPDQVEAAGRVWEYGAKHGLQKLMEQLPLHQAAFRFEDDDVFCFKPARSASSIATAEEFVDALGLVPMERGWIAEVTQADWTNLLRREAVRQGKGLNVQTITGSSMVEVSCSACWDLTSWAVHFEQPEWLTLDKGEYLHAERPSEATMESLLLEALDAAQRQFPIATKIAPMPPTDTPWMRSIEGMYEWHRSILVTNEMGLSPWMRRVWAAVWTVVYRERNRLRGECDLSSLRQEIAECFRSAPQLTEWMFVFARLVCAVRFERGLGIAADFVDRFA